VFCHPDYEGEIGLIMPYEKDFCATCNRLRVSSVGKLHLCLFGDGGVSLRDLLADDSQQTALEARIAQALTHKKQTHFLHQGNTGITQNLSYIGGYHRIRRFLMSQFSADFIPTRIAILTVTSRRTEEDDTSGHYLRDAAQEVGHHIVDKAIVKENR